MPASISLPASIIVKLNSLPTVNIRYQIDRRHFQVSFFILSIIQAMQMRANGIGRM